MWKEYQAAAPGARHREGLGYGTPLDFSLLGIGNILEPPMGLVNGYAQGTALLFEVVRSPLGQRPLLAHLIDDVPEAGREVSMEGHWKPECLEICQVGQTA